MLCNTSEAVPPAAADAVAERPEREEGGGEGDRVAVDDPEQLALRGAEVGGERLLGHVEARDRHHDGEQREAGEEVHLRHILVQAGPATMRDVDSACVIAQEARDKIADGEIAFGDMAQRVTDVRENTAHAKNDATNPNSAPHRYALVANWASAWTSRENPKHETTHPNGAECHELCSPEKLVQPTCAEKMRPAHERG